MKICRLFFIFLLVHLQYAGIAGEGMWIPMLLQQNNEKEMQEMGMNISAEDIYSINHSSMKDAIVLFGRGCTGEIISKEGLLLTNHHCGFGQIQKHSSVDHDYLTDGFWAMNREEELPNPGLTATIMVEMKDVTKAVLEGTTQQMTQSARSTQINNNAKKLIDAFKKDSGYNAYIKEFYEGNQYYMIITEVFKDIRLVGAPPSNIGKFGGDTDNWMWPRHTGDFSLFRIYVGKDGKPATYAEDNVPYQPNYHFPISIKGVEEDDFTFVFGYPAKTSEYLPSFAIQMITELQNPQKIMLREKRLEIFKSYADQNREVRIQYATKEARVANAWKKWIGEKAGILRMNGVQKKQLYEQRFQEWAASDPDLNQKYGMLLPAFENTYQQLGPLNVAYDYYREAGLAIELVGFAQKYARLVRMSTDKNTADSTLMKEIEGLKKQNTSFFKDYYKPIDQEVMIALLKLYDAHLDPAYKPDFFKTIHHKFKGDYKAFVAHVFKNTRLDDPEEMDNFLTHYNNNSYKKILKDPAYKMYHDLEKVYNSKIKSQRAALNHTLDSLQRLYMAGQMEMEPAHNFYPDANFTLRVSYGKVNGYHPKDAVYYRHFTTLEGILEKENPDIYDYVVEDRLKELAMKHDYGPYADKDGSLHIAFTASNHTTGGNSGSPVLNADGHLVGVNFDRCWEGTMSDLMYDPTVCRNISIDIRYFLFLVDKFAGAGYLVEEMDLMQ